MLSLYTPGMKGGNDENRTIRIRSVIHGYSVATVNKYDITSIKDVVKILKWINHEDTNEEYAREFSKKLQAFDIFIRLKMNWKGKMTAEKLVKKGFVPKRKF